MRKNINRILQIEINLDSSETLMFTKGGMHKVEIPNYILRQECADLSTDNDEDDEAWDTGWIIGETKTIVTFQMDKSEKNRFNFVTDDKFKQST